MKFILAHKSVFIKLFWASIFISSTIFVIIAINPQLAFLWRPLGLKAGTLTAVLFFAALTPGILRRFRVKGYLQQLQIILTSFRRQLGIATYLTGVSHYWLVKGLPALNQNLPLTPTNNFQLLGSISLSLMLPLFLTSNNFSTKLLGKYWNILHKLVYLIAWTIAFHILLNVGINKSGLAILLLALAEITSFVYAKITQPAPPPPSSTESPS